MSEWVKPHQGINGWMGVYVNSKVGDVNEWINGCEWMKVWIEWMNVKEWMNVNEWMNECEWMNELMNVNEWMNE